MEQLREVWRSSTRQCERQEPFCIESGCWSAANGSQRVYKVTSCTGKKGCHSDLYRESLGAVWKSRWPSWVPCPNELYGFCGRKATLNHAHALVTVCPWYDILTSEDIKLHIIIINSHSEEEGSIPEESVSIKRISACLFSTTQTFTSKMQALVVHERVKALKGESDL